MDNSDDTQTPKNVKEIEETARQLLYRFLQPDAPGDLAEYLRPEPEDFREVFVESAVERAREGYNAVWMQSPRPKGNPGQTVVRVWAVPASLLTDENELSMRFPNGYRAIAHLFNPHRIWLAWKFLAPGERAGMAYDGLVWRGDRFAWFPKPYRILGD